MFNYNLNQNNFNPQNGNNYCGGFALAAVINSIQNQGPNQPPPMPVYHAIQGHQNVLEPNSQQLVNVTIQNNTHICLLSSIAMEINIRGLNSKTVYNQGLLPAPFGPVLPEEQVRLNAQNLQHMALASNL